MHAQTRILFSFQESRSQNSEERGQNQLTGLSLPFWLLNSGFHIPLLFSGISRGEAPHGERRRTRPHNIGYISQDRRLARKTHRLPQTESPRPAEDPDVTFRRRWFVLIGRRRTPSGTPAAPRDQLQNSRTGCLAPRLSEGGRDHSRDFPASLRWSS